MDCYFKCNGSYVTVHGKVIHKVIFEDEELAALIAYMDAHGINYILESNDFCYVKDLKDPSYLHFMDNFQLPEDNFVQYKNLQQVHGCISKITLAFGNRSSLQKSKQLLRPHYQMSLHRNCDTLDIGKKAVHKGVGAKAIMEHYGIPYEATYAFGDGDNDVELLASVRYGIAMRKHDPLLDDVAYMVTGTVKEEGIFEALKKLEVI